MRVATTVDAAPIGEAAVAASEVEVSPAASSLASTAMGDGAFRQTDVQLVAPFGHEVATTAERRAHFIDALLGNVRASA